jgi:hypothetical protein
MALVWRSGSHRNRLLRKWRHAIFMMFGNQPRCIRLAWVLHDLFNVDHVFAYPSDPYLAHATGLALNKLQATLMILDQGGAIIRVHVTEGGKKQRRIYPSRSLIPPESGGIDTPQTTGGQNLNIRARRKQSLTQRELARLGAERKERDGKEREATEENDQDP